MRRVFTIKGIIYSDNKIRIKGLMKSNGLKWVGSQFNAIWKSDTETVKADFERENGVTVEVVLTYTGPGDNDFISGFTSFLLHLGAKGHDESETVNMAEIDKVVEAEMKTWDIVNKPNVEMMRRGECRRPPAPERFIEAALKDYDKRRLIKVQEVRKMVMKDHGFKDEEKRVESMTKKEKEQMSIDDILNM